MANFDAGYNTVNSIQESGESIQPSKDKNKSLDEQISVFLDDGILSVKEQEYIINQMVNSDSTINTAKEFGFDLQNSVQVCSSIFNDVKLDKEDSEIFDIKINFINKRLMRTFDTIKNFASMYLQSEVQSEDITNTNGSVMQTINKDKAGNIFETIKYEYDDNGYVKKETTEDAQGNLKSIREYNDGIITNQVMYNDTYTAQYDYDENGFENKRTVTFKDGSVEVFEGNTNNNNLRFLLSLGKKLFK